ncbi:MAG: hypothetical protein AABZ60_19875 [Planctomycetota bacterium]|mgnify:CR=1 FL=1
MGEVRIEKRSENQYYLTNGSLSVEFDKEKFEDLYYAVPLNNTGFLRLLLDNISQNDDHRHTINKMLDATPSRNQTLKALQEQIQKMEKP